MRLLIGVSTPFGNLLSGAGISVTVLGVGTALAQGRLLFGPLQGGTLDWLTASVLLMLPLVVVLVGVYPPKSRAIRAAIADATAKGGLTPDVAAAWADPVLRAARTYELVAVTTVLVLMIAKPF